MARLTKTQIDYLTFKIEKKVQEKTEQINGKLKLTAIEEKAEKMFKQKAFQKWLFTQKPEVICQWIKDGCNYPDILTNRFCDGRWLFSMKDSCRRLADDKSSIKKRWFKESGLPKLLEEYKKIENEAEKQIKAVKKEADQLIDKAVFSGMAPDVMKAVDAFLEI